MARIYFRISNMAQRESTLHSITARGEIVLLLSWELLAVHSFAGAAMARKWVADIASVYSSSRSSNFRKIVSSF